MVDSDHADISNAYTILSNIQGFDSFHLGPTSSPDEIKRAFQTQSLIWHPEKNPGDPQAQAVFRRMQQAYTLLMDTPSRAELDSRPQSTGTAAPGSTEQLPAEDEAGQRLVGLADDGEAIVPIRAEELKHLTDSANLVKGLDAWRHDVPRRQIGKAAGRLLR